MNNFNEQLDKALNTWGAPKETLVELVQSYQNNELGASSNSSNNSESSTSSCDCGDKVTSLQTQINQLTLELNENTEKLNLLLNKLYDRSAIYNTNYDHIDPSILFRTYDFIEKEKSITTTSNSSTYPVGLFCLNGSQAKVKLTLNIKANTANGIGNITFYVNGATFQTVSLDSITTTEQKYEFIFDVELLDTGNYLETVVYTTSSNSITITYLKYEAYNCTNPTFIDIDSRYNVDYYNGNYYISDCSGSTAKYAIVPVDTFNSFNDVNWVDTEIEAISYRFIDNLVLEGNKYYHDSNVSNFYITKNNTMYLYDVNNDKTYTERHIIHAEPIFPLSGELNVFNSATSGRIINSQIYVFKNAKARAYSYINNASKYYMIYGPKNYLTGMTSVLEKSIYFAHSMDNNITFIYKNVTCSLGYGKFISAYITKTSPLTIEAYTKVHDYCVKHNIVYNISSSIPTVESYTSEVCGTYDLYFKGYNNDYFTVENNIWHYYQSDLLES